MARMLLIGALAIELAAVAVIGVTWAKLTAELRSGPAAPVEPTPPWLDRGNDKVPV